MGFLLKSVIHKSVGWNNGVNVGTSDRWTPQMDAGGPTDGPSSWTVDSRRDEIDDDDDDEYVR